ncbi:TniQ family protein [Mycobacterium hodleri]|uniref:TniQ family protein n=2 Tax=Mycolicibacterium hodleri TaxID=49897 RepID=A0A544VWK7_9MYCO|nr:TniQ family protein [Mycolicibacterium hodleri]
MPMLPSRISLADGEALDGFLERLGAANDLRSPQLLRLLTAPGESGTATTAFLMVTPDLAIVDSITALSGLDADSVRHATLARFDHGLPLRLDGFDPRERHSFRQVVTQGWFPAFGSQACPRCLVDDGVWRIEWRLPLLAVCVRHAVFLTTRCTRCGRRFRADRHTPLRPHLGPGQPCGNPVGVRNPCVHPVTAHPTEIAPCAVIDTANTVRHALAGEPMMMLGQRTAPHTYLAELRHLATLLLHLLSRPGAADTTEWAVELHREAAQRTTPRRGPRWGISPPHSARLRGEVLREAHDILDHTNLDEAAARLAPWLGPIADVGNGPRGWLLNRTTRTATMEHLIDAALAGRHPVSRRLDSMSCDGLLRPTAIPQLIDTDIYREFFTGMLSTGEPTGRLYVSLCLIRTVAPVANWAQAAAHLELDAVMGARTARTASARLHVTAQTFAAAVDSAGRVVPRDRDFRRRESQVRALAGDSAAWFARWRRSMSPARRDVARPYAITWMWCEVAQGALDLSPAWPEHPSRVQKAAYRHFRDALPAPAQHMLRSLVVHGEPGR